MTTDTKIAYLVQFSYFYFRKLEVAYRKLFHGKLKEPLQRDASEIWKHDQKNKEFYWPSAPHAVYSDKLQN